MKASEFRAAFAIANDKTKSLENVDDSALFGCGLPGYPVTVVTAEQLAKLIRWQALQFNGQWDGEALQELRYIARYKFEFLSKVA